MTSCVCRARLGVTDPCLRKSRYSHHQKLMLQAHYLHIGRWTSLATCSVGCAITAAGWSQCAWLGKTSHGVFIGFLYFTLKKNSIRVQLREKWGKLKMSRKETIKPPRLVIQGILLWLVDVCWLHSTRSLFWGIIHLTNWHITNRKYVVFSRGMLAVPAVQKGNMGYICSSFLLCTVWMFSFQALADWTHTLWDLY